MRSFTFYSLICRLWHYVYFISIGGNGGGYNVGLLSLGMAGGWDSLLILVTHAVCFGFMLWS